MKKFKSEVLSLHKLNLDVDAQRSLKNVYQAYQTSWETEQLEGERNRQTHGELIEVDRKILDPVEFYEASRQPEEIMVTYDDESSDDDDEVPQQQQQIDSPKAEWWTKFSVETNRPKFLKDIAIETIGKNLRTGKIDDRIVCEDAEKLGKLIDSEIHVVDLLEVDNVAFWKTLVKSKLQNSFQYDKLTREIDLDLDWKKIGIQLKLEEIIENKPEAEFRYESTRDELFKTVDRVSKFVDTLNIKKLQPRLGPIFHPTNNTVEMVNIPENESHHGSLECIGRLTNLKVLSVNFKPNRLGIHYARRFVQTSIEDMRNLGSALQKLDKLEEFCIRETSFSNYRKLCHVIKPLMQMRHLRVLDFSFCGIKSSRSGQFFNDLLKVTTSLKELHLKGNCIDDDFCMMFAESLRSFKGKFEFLDLSLNEILGSGLGLILKSIRETENVKKLDVSQCDNLHSGRKGNCLIELIKLLRSCSKNLKSLDFHLNDIEDEQAKTQIIRALNLNYEIKEFDAQLCGFSTSQMVDIKVLIERNRYYRENPILKKDHFTLDDEIEAEKFLTRTKHPILLKLQEKYSHPSRKRQQVHHKYALHDQQETEENYMKFAKIF